MTANYLRRKRDALMMVSVIADPYTGIYQNQLMGEDNIPAFIELSASSTAGTNSTYKLFDGLSRTAGLITGNSDPVPQWMQYKTDIPIRPTKFVLTQYTDISYLANGIQISASSDGSNFTALVTANMPNTVGTSVSYPVTTTELYQYFRITVTSFQSGNTKAWLGDFQINGLVVPFTASVATPVMTSNTTRRDFSVSASSEYSSTYPAWKATTRNTSQIWQAAAGYPAWILYDFGFNVKAETASIAGNSTSSGAPKDIEVQGSNDGTNFTTLLSTALEKDKTVRDFSISGTYRYFRLVVTTGQTGATRASISEFVITGKR